MILFLPLTILLIILATSWFLRRRFFSQFKAPYGALYKNGIVYNGELKINDWLTYVYHFHDGYLLWMEQRFNDGSYSRWEKESVFLKCYDRRGHIISNTVFKTLHNLKEINPKDWIKLFEKEFSLQIYVPERKVI